MFTGSVWFFDKVYHWTYTVKKKMPTLTLHPGPPEKCKRVHRDAQGARS